MLVNRIQRIDAFIALAFGIGFVVLPELVIGIFGARTDAAGLIVARLLGASALSLAAVSWYTSRAPESDLRRDIIRGQAGSNVLSLIVMTVATATGTVNALGWAIVALFAVLGAVRFYGTAAQEAATA
jgi:Ca2+/Na+ antiporter